MLRLCFLSFLSLVLAALACLRAEASEVSLRRALLVTACDARGRCQAPVKVATEDELARIPLHPTRKGGFRGLTGTEEKRFVHAGTLFRVFLRVSKQDGETDRHVYAMLRSGPTLRRHGVITHFNLDALGPEGKRSSPTNRSAFPAAARSGPP